MQQNVTSFEVKVAVADPQRLLHAGMNVTIDFKAGELTQVLVVPTAALAKPLRMRIVTHDANVAARTQRVIQMVDGIIVENAHNFLKLSL